MNLSALNFTGATVFKRFEFNLNAKPKILTQNQNSSANSHKIERQSNNEASASEKKEYEKVFNARISDEVRRAEAGMTTIYFRDPITRKLTRSALSGESLSALGREFGSDDLKKRADGSYILSGKAENFVAGWYADIAYTRGYLKADKNADGFFSESELKNVRSGFIAQTLENTDTGEISNLSFVESYIKLDGDFTTPFNENKAFKETATSLQGDFGSKTIGIELDKMIKKDKNLDGKLTYNEMGGERLQAETTRARGDLFNAAEMAFAAVNFKKLNAQKGLNNPDGIILNNAKTSDMWVKQSLDKLASGVEFDDLNSNEQAILKWHLRDKIFDEKKDEFDNTYLEFNKEKFENFYAEFKESFQQRSAEFLGLSNKDTGGLDYENLSKIVDELYNTFLDTYSTSISTIGDTINLRDRQFDISV